MLEDQKGPDASYNYGSHFLFQGHENGVTKDGKQMGYFTRVNLDADEAHRVTLMADHDSSGNGIAFIDGSTWNPVDVVPFFSWPVARNALRLVYVVLPQLIVNADPLGQ